MFILVTASFFFVCGVSAADSAYQTPLNAGETVSPTLTTGYYNVTLDPGERFYFNWSLAQNGGASNIAMDGIAPVSAGTNYAFIWSTVTTDTSTATATTGHAEFVNVGSSSYTIDCSVSITFTLRNNNSSTATPRVLLSVSGNQVLSSSFVTNNQLDSKLNQILNALGDSSGNSDFLGDNALVYFDSRYFNDTKAYNGAISVDSDTGLFNLTDCSGMYLETSDNTPAVFLDRGRYYAIFNQPSSASSYTFSFGGIADNTSDNPEYKIDRAYTFTYGNKFVVVVFDVILPFSTSSIFVGFGGSYSGLFYGGIVRASADDSASAAVNPDQSGLVDDVNNAGQQQQQQEDQLWTNINSYKGDLTFNLDDWSEAAGGLSYVSGIFMSIWNNSPTQIIILSLMLGIAMLSIGRGAMAAVRVSRNRRDDD